jgi:hypothetical protein
MAEPAYSVLVAQLRVKVESTTVVAEQEVLEIILLLVLTA